MTKVSPDWLAHRYDPRSDTIQFVRIDRQTRRSTTFLTDQYFPENIERETKQRGAPPGEGAPLRYIFHSAFCCSTLLAGALDAEGLATSLKEPQLLNDLVGWNQRGAPRDRVTGILGEALALLARPFTPGEAVVIKPSNIVNAFAPAMLRLRPEARAVLLYAPLDTFLTSVAKKGLDGRLWVRELFLSLRKDGMAQRLGFDDAQLFGQTDLQIAALGWLAQAGLFAELVKAFGPARVRSLDSETLLARPGDALSAVATHFGLDISAERITSIVETAFTRHGKTGEAYDATARADEYRAATEAHADEIAKVAHWARAVAEARNIPLTPGAALS